MLAVALGVYEIGLLLLVGAVVGGGIGLAIALTRSRGRS